MTSYAEVALNPRRADQAHPAFAKLFLETEYLRRRRALLCRRRPRARGPAAGLGPPRPGERGARRNVEYETDRARFLGRGRSTANPAAMDRRAGTFGDRGTGAGPGLQPARSGSG